MYLFIYLLTNRQTYRQTNTFIHGSDHNNDVRAEFYTVTIYETWLKLSEK